MLEARVQGRMGGWASLLEERGGGGGGSHGDGALGGIYSIARVLNLFIGTRMWDCTLLKVPLEVEIHIRSQGIRHRHSGIDDYVMRSLFARYEYARIFAIV